MSSVFLKQDHEHPGTEITFRSCFGPHGAWLSTWHNGGAVCSVETPKTLHQIAEIQVFIIHLAHPNLATQGQCPCFEFKTV